MIRANLASLRATVLNRLLVVGATMSLFALVAAATGPEEKDTVVLSPFEVRTEKDRGFMATNAGTATKLGLDLADMPAAYSVMTRELIDSLGITNLEESSAWVVGGATAVGDGTPNDSTSTPNTVFTTQRGQMNQTGQQRNFFLNAGIGDTYNTERIDFGRGPNAVLFNFGDINNPFAGGVSAQTKQARVDRSIDSVSFRAGSWGYLRSSVDTNRPLSSKVALRANALYQKSDGWRDGQQDNRRAISLALTYRLGPKTELRVGTNYDHIERSQTYAAIFDNLSGWDGVTVLDGPITNAILGAGRNSTTKAPLAGTTFNGGQFLSSSGDVQGVTRVSTTPRNVFIPGQGIMNWQNYATTQKADSNEYIPIYSGGRALSRYDLWAANVAGGTFQSSTIAPNNLLSLGTGAINGGSPLLYQDDLPEDRFDRVVKGSHFTVPGKRFTMMPRNLPFLIENNNGINTTFSHRVGERLYLNIAGDVNQNRQRIINQGSANRMRWAYIDINKNLPDGTPNPKFLEPYSDDVNIAFRRYTVQNAGIRPSLNYSLDAGKWGSYTFNAGLSFTKRTIKDRQWILSMAQAADPRTWAGDASVVKIRMYWDSPYYPLDLGSNLSYYTNTFDSSNNVTGSSRSTVTPKYVNNGGSDYFETNKGVTFATAGRFFRSEYLQRERLILTAGATLTNAQTYRRDMMIRGDIPAGWDSVSMVWKPDAPSDWRSLTYVPKDANGKATATIARPATTRPRATAVEGVAAPLAQYSGDRFRDDYNLPRADATTRNVTTGFVYNLLRWASLKFNYSNSFLPPAAGALDINTDPAEPVTAYGYDTRLSLTPFGGRLVLNLGWFYNQSAHTRTTSPAATYVNSLFATRDYADTNTNNRNSFGFYDLTGSDYQSTNNTGGELELVGQVARGLQISGSYSRFRGHNFNRFPLTVPYIDAHAEDFLKVLVAAGGKLDTANKPIGASHAPGLAIADPSITGLNSTQSTNQTNAINAYNNIWVQYDNVLNKTSDTAYGAHGSMDWGQTFNVFVRYEIQTGTLKGLRFGLGQTWDSPYAWTTQATNLVPNPNYDKTKAFNTNTGVLGDDGRYTYKDSSGKATGYNAPWMPDPSIDQRNPTRNVSHRAVNTVLNIGYTRKFGPRSGWLSGKEMVYNLVVNNLFNKQMVGNDSGATLRAPNGDYFNNQNTRVNTKGGLGFYQQPINFSLEVTLKF